MVTNEFKLRILDALKDARSNFGGSDAKFAISIGINAAQWSRIKNGEVDKILSDANWISLARTYNVQLRQEREWKTAKTPVYEFIMHQLTMAQQESGSLLLCDIADIGKTYCARIYAATNLNAVYVDCSQVKSKQKLVRHIAKLYGCGYNGRYSDVYADLVFYLRSIQNPMVILDEAGDLNYEAFLELKALWNATERCCGWCMMGADGLKEKMRRSIEFKKVGYTELFSRYGSRYQKITPDGSDELRKFARLQAALIIKANAPTDTADVQKIIMKTDGSLRRIYNELSKLSA
ncbi:MAG TPA: AAA family ATPase [Lentimicrobium sp.]|nr:AAA family ATPase [Bacteroidales bacterium]HLO92457.1 AAA family ATPase [Lentimicrobium sp.]